MSYIKTINNKIFGVMDQGVDPLFSHEFKLSSDLEIDNKEYLVDIIKRRRSNRIKPSGICKFSEFSFILENSLGVTQKKDSKYYYSIPCAGTLRDIRYIIIINNISDFNFTGSAEYSPERGSILTIDNTEKNCLFFEDWEKESNFSIIFCLPSNPNRKYLNNEFLASFEAGCASQNLQLISSMLNYNSCISGVINVPEFIKYFGSLTPMQSISFSKE